MATMFGFMATDAPVSVAVARALLRDTVEQSFNMLTIDGDTSPSDTVVLLANGAAGGDEIGESHPALPLLSAAVRQVAIVLTRMLARDGEGTGKLIEVRVDGARSAQDARVAAKAIAGSALVKSAVFGNDPNWGRIVVALGYSGAETEEARTSVEIQGVSVYSQGSAVLFDETGLSRALRQEEVKIRVDLSLGHDSATSWGCDLTPEYVRINSEYTT
jgi:glutamate N-acetyltransferase/amino-acid N-acetyltransferase